MAIELLVFHVDEGRFGIPARQVREVLPALTMSPVADAPAVIMGVINLRGQVVVVLDARRLLEFSERELVHTDHLIVIESEGQSLAMRVDRAVDLVAVDEVDFQPADAHTDGKGKCHFVKTSSGLVQLVDVGRCIAEIENALPIGDSLLDGSEANA